MLILKRILQEFKIFKEIIKRDERFSVNFFKKIRLNLSGFNVHQYYIFNLKSNNKSEYLTKYDREKAKILNGHYNIVLDNKLLFHELFRNYVTLAKNYFWIKNGLIYPLVDNSFRRTLDEVIKEERSLIFKPVGGGSGKGIYLIEHIDNRIYLNKKLISTDAFKELLESSDDFIVCEQLKQHKYSDTIFSKTINTIRIVSLKYPNNRDAEIAIAVHRFGVTESVPVDNARSGGVVSLIELDSGILSAAKSYYSDEIFTHHPESNEPIENVVIPNWDIIKKEIIRIATLFPYLKLMAWDIVVTTNGFAVIEINKSTDFDLLQLWGGLRESALGKFLKFNKIINKKRGEHE